jgi:hypothetical protein
MSSGAGKFCPACQLLNDAAATECMYCGVPFEKNINTDAPTTTKMQGDTTLLTTDAKVLLDNVERGVPENGIAIYLTNHERPFDVRIEDDIIIGRKAEATDNVIDLTPFRAFEMGISRRHVRIQRVENSYQITDLESTNGTWLNGKRLLPDKPVPLPNAAQLRLGSMRLFVIYRLKNN